MLPELHTNFSRGRSGSLVFPSLSEFSTVYCDPYSRRKILKKRGEINETEEKTNKQRTLKIIEKAREFQENIYFCFIDYAKAFDCVDRNKLWKILQEMGKPDHPNCLLRNLHEGQTTVRTRHRTDSKLGKEYIQAVYCHPAYLTYSRVHHEKCWAG